MKITKLLIAFTLLILQYIMVNYYSDYISYNISNLTEGKLTIYSKNNKEEKLIYPIVMTIASTKLTNIEKQFLAEANPFGILLHCYNMPTKDKVIELINEIKTVSKRDDIFFMVDQEGGRVDRTKCFTKKASKPQLYYGDIAKTNLTKAKQEVYKNALLTAENLKEIGVNLNLAPVLDVLHLDYDRSLKQSYISSKDTKEDIGDRAFSNNPLIVAELGQQVIKAMQEKNVFVGVKHIPGLGSSKVNSHYELPIITKSKVDLIRDDFLPFKKLNYVNFALVPHAKYTSLDKLNISTFSSKVVSIIREEIGFNGFLITDALNMKALGEIPIEEKVAKSFNAGFDIVMPYFVTQDIMKYRKILQAIPKNKVIEFNNKLKAL